MVWYDGRSGDADVFDQNEIWWRRRRRINFMVGGKRERERSKGLKPRGFSLKRAPVPISRRTGGDSAPLAAVSFTGGCGDCSRTTQRIGRVDAVLAGPGRFRRRPQAEAVPAVLACAGHDAACMEFGVVVQRDRVV